MNRIDEKSGRARRGTRVIAVVLASLVSFPALADPPKGMTGAIEHEYVAFDPATDSALGQVTLPGGLSAEIPTYSGKITAPDVGRPITPKTPIYSTKSAVPGESFAPDLDTRRPKVSPYDDPFRPSVSPFKRLVALDSIDRDYVLGLTRARKIAVDLTREPTLAEPIDPFYLDLALDLVAGEPIRLPTPIAGYVIKKAHLAPSVGFTLLRDGAENLFLIPDGSGKARLAMELATPRDAFAGFSKRADWSDLSTSLVAKLPSRVQAAADVAAKELGIDKSAMSPVEAVRAMVAYFRAFKDSTDAPTATGDIFLDLFRAKKGVCRHRAFAMMVLANGLGIPARFIHNEAHAWIEVHDGSLWRRIDLGGASERLDDTTETPETPQPRHDPPADPFDWPAGSTRGSDLLPPAPKPSPSSGSTGTGGSDPSSPPPSTSATVSTLPPSKLTFSLRETPEDSKDDPVETQRGNSFSVRGKLTAADGSPCKKVRVEVVLHESGGGGEKLAGTLLTDDMGAFDGSVPVPSDLPLGDYSVTVRTPGAHACGASSSE